MDEKGTQRPVDPVRRASIGLSVDQETRRIADELAARYHGDNVSRLIRHLILDAWQREEEKAVA